MKRGDVFVQIVAEVSGFPVADIPVRILKQYMQFDLGFDEEISEDEAERLLIELRKDKNAIRNWLGQGFFRALYRHADPMGSGQED